MDIHRIHSDKAKLVEQHGPWISHNIKLAATVIRYALGTLVKGNARSAIFKLSPISPEDHSKTCEFSTWPVAKVCMQSNARFMEPTLSVSRAVCTISLKASS